MHCIAPYARQLRAPLHTLNLTCTVSAVAALLRSCDLAGNRAKGGSGSDFNPFGLPSPSFASPVPVTADNRFADVSPMADAPPPSILAPMRVSTYQAFRFSHEYTCPTPALVTAVIRFAGVSPVQE